ncbi:hypothetical protein ACU8V7_18205 [Zobellia nedashkovskayae]
MENFTLLNFKNGAFKTVTYTFALAVFGLSSSFVTIGDVENSNRNEAHKTNTILVADSDTEGCMELGKEISGRDFGFPDNVQDGSLSAENVDLSSKWGLPVGSVIVSVNGANTKSSGTTLLR